MDFEVAAAGLTRSRLDLTKANAATLLTRVRWFEAIRDWEHTQLATHELSRFIGKVPKNRLNPPCGIQCRNALEGDTLRGRILLPLWNVNFNGTIIFELANLTTQGGDGFIEWDEVCNKKDGFCFRGLNGYQVAANYELSVPRVDMVWVVRLWGEENQGRTLRIDGSVGISFHQRREPNQNATAPEEITAVKRSAIFLEENSLVYKNYSLKDKCVDVLAQNGSFRCTFSSDSTSGSCQKLEQGTPKGSGCKPVAGVPNAFSWP